MVLSAAAFAALTACGRALALPGTASAVYDRLEQLERRYDA
jgi:hypothetical protein